MFSHPSSDEYIADMANLWVKVIHRIDQDRSILPNFLKLFEELFKLLVQKSTLPVDFFLDYNRPKDQDSEDLEEGEDLEAHNTNDHDEVKQKCRDSCQEILKDFTRIIPAREILLIMVSVLKSQSVMVILDFKGYQFHTLPHNAQYAFTVFEACIHLINSLVPIISESND